MAQDWTRRVLGLEVDGIVVREVDEGRVGVGRLALGSRCLVDDLELGTHGDGVFFCRDGFGQHVVVDGLRCSVCRTCVPGRQPQHTGVLVRVLCPDLCSRQLCGERRLLVEGGHTQNRVEHKHQFPSDTEVLSRSVVGVLLALLRRRHIDPGNGIAVTHPPLQSPQLGGFPPDAHLRQQDSGVFVSCAGQCLGNASSQRRRSGLGGSGGGAVCRCLEVVDGSPEVTQALLFDQGRVLAERLERGQCDLEVLLGHNFLQLY